jgi:hypothetical protein
MKRRQLISLIVAEAGQLVILPKANRNHLLGTQRFDGIYSRGTRRRNS